MPLREMKWQMSRGLYFGARGSKAASGLNPGTRPAISPWECEPRMGWESSSWSGRTERKSWCLGFRITANHHGIKMFTGRGGISFEQMILMLLFLPHEFSFEPHGMRRRGHVMKCVCHIFVLTSRFMVIIFSTFRANVHMRSLK